MANFSPIRGISYNINIVEDLSLVTTPPYDVISPQAQENYYNRHPHNIIRLEFGKNLPGDNAKDNVYTRARNFYHDWLVKGILKRESSPCFYLYQQHFDTVDQPLVRTGLIGGLGLSSYGVGKVLPHEETLPGAKADRLELLRTCRANFSSIFGLYADPARRIESLVKPVTNAHPDARVRDEDGTDHLIWRVNQNDILDAVQETLEPLTVYIADGHHRYETALEYSREANHPGAGHILATLVNLYDHGLVILPTHRLLARIPQEKEAFLAELSGIFRVEALEYPKEDLLGQQAVLARIKERMEQEVQGAHAFGLYLGGSDIYILTREIMKGPTLDRELDVTVLQKLVLENLLGLTTATLEGSGGVTYTRDAFYGLRSVQDGHHQAFFLVNPTLLEQVTTVAGAGLKMPQKSTFFYPKLLTGLVVNPLVD